MKRPRRSRAFSLVEILTVIGILAVLMAIVFPIFVSARRSGARSTCFENVHSLGVAMFLYLGDHDDAFPESVGANPGGAWAYLLFPYAKSREIYRCPADPTTPDHDPKWGGHPTDTLSYGLNSNLPGVHASTRFRRDTPSHSGLAAPTRTVMFFEVEDDVANLEHPTGYAQDDTVPRGDTPTGNTASNPLSEAATGRDEPQDYVMGQSASGPDPAVRFATGAIGGRLLNQGKGSKPRHDEMAIYLACDGHAKEFRPQRVSGGADAADASCDQGTVRGQAGPCAAQRAESAAGTGNDRYSLTFSAR